MPIYYAIYFQFSFIRKINVFYRLNGSRWVPSKILGLMDGSQLKKETNGEGVLHGDVYWLEAKNFGEGSLIGFFQEANLAASGPSLSLSFPFLYCFYSIHV